MPSFGDSIFLFVLALILFGPKKLPELARQLGKLMAEFRRASNEFRVQMEDELRVADQAERQKQIAAIEAAAPAPALTASEPAASEAANTIAPPPSSQPTASEPISAAPASVETPATQEPAAINAIDEKPDRSAKLDTASAATTPLPIAVSGELRIMPPSTGLPTGNSSLTSLINSVPRATATPEPANESFAEPAPATEEALHG